MIDLEIISDEYADVHADTIFVDAILDEDCGCVRVFIVHLNDDGNEVVVMYKIPIS